MGRGELSVRQDNGHAIYRRRIAVMPSYAGFRKPGRSGSAVVGKGDGYRRGEKEKVRYLCRFE